MMEQSDIVFACDGNGMGMNGMMFSVHKDYTDFRNSERNKGIHF
jgi:hypothetical protein